MEAIRQNINIAITPRPRDLARVVHSMDADEQVQFLEQLFYEAFEGTGTGYTQLDFIREAVKKWKAQGKVGIMIDIIHDYLGTKGLRG